MAELRAHAFLKSGYSHLRKVFKFKIYVFNFIQRYKRNCNCKACRSKVSVNRKFLRTFLLFLSTNAVLIYNRK